MGIFCFWVPLKCSSVIRKSTGSSSHFMTGTVILCPLIHCSWKVTQPSFCSFCFQNTYYWLLFGCGLCWRTQLGQEMDGDFQSSDHNIMLWCLYKHIQSCSWEQPSWRSIHFLQHLLLQNLLGDMVIHHYAHMLSLLLRGLSCTHAVVTAALLKVTGRAHINHKVPITFCSYFSSSTENV